MKKFPKEVPCEKHWTPQPTSSLAGALALMLNNHPQAFGSDLEKLRGWVRSRSWNKLLTWAGDSIHVPTAEHVGDQMFMVRRQFVALFKKYAFTPNQSGLDPETTALSAFIRAERRCGRINLRFRGRNTRFSPHEEFFVIAAKYIERTIGEKPDWDSIKSLCDFGGGASVGVHGNSTHIGRKLMVDTWTCTPSALPYAAEALWSNDQVRDQFPDLLYWKLSPEARKGFKPVSREVSAFVDFLYDVAVGEAGKVHHNIIGFVPKTAKTHRTIAVEPLLNGFLQKGVDAFLADRLKERGIDVHDQWNNQEWARRGSLMNRDPYATLDLSQASDSLSIELVKRLLPPDWFVFLNAIRSPSYLMNGQVTRYNKFCSMGNGFCFPLETLIFAAICHATYRVNGQTPELLVYGDDIIVRQNIALAVIEMLKYCGFTINTDKSFVFGRFRESCGADWLQGQDITPVYLREPLRTLQSVVDLHNSLYVNVGKQDLRFPDLCDYLKTLPPERIRFLELRRQTAPRCNTRWTVSGGYSKRPLSRAVPYNSGFLCTIDEFMASPHSKWDADTRSWVSRGLVTTAVPDSEFRHPLRIWVEYLAVLRGAKTSQPLSLRRSTRTRTRYIGCAETLDLIARGSRTRSRP